MTDRLTPEREAEIRHCNDQGQYFQEIDELFAEIDALRAELALRSAPTADRTIQPTGDKMTEHVDGLPRVRTVCPAMHVVPSFGTAIGEMEVKYQGVKCGHCDLPVVGSPGVFNARLAMVPESPTLIGVTCEPCNGRGGFGTGRMMDSGEYDSETCDDCGGRGYRLASLAPTADTERDRLAQQVHDAAMWLRRVARHLPEDSPMRARTVEFAERLCPANPLRTDNVRLVQSDAKTEEGEP